MNSGYFFLGLLLATFVWQIVAQSLGPVVGGWFYGLQVENLKKSGYTFCCDEEVQEWRDKAIASSMNWGLILLAVLCGGLAGTFGFPLIGFSRSTNPWSWARMIALCGASWFVLSVAHPEIL
ncbi:hypothetical protein [Prochlorococcus sp. MIT 0601]|uniref:hypothetical protein n=2 Tax=Prochlorococcus TaxID=1218 RepID=UPI000533AA09|nr:hypothetical protein [Prochlorococcus sp. MIT 0601]KGG14404.1 hypothetical protein EV05_0011 [Prochlorococcus sp. MIT 0601]